MKKIQIVMVCSFAFFILLSMGMVSKCTAPTITDTKAVVSTEAVSTTTQISTIKKEETTTTKKETTTTEKETTTEVVIETEAPSEITTTKHQTTTPSITTTIKNKSYSDPQLDQLSDNQNEILGYVLEVCDKYPNVKPAMVMGVIEKESDFNRYADNGTCKGLMQVYESCHRDRMERLGVSNLFDAYSNILVGVDILDEYYRNTGNWPDAFYYYSGRSSSYYGNLVPRIEKYEGILGSLNY